MPEPRTDESRQDFISRCIPELIEEGNDQEQASAICFRIWDEGKSEDMAISRKEIEFSNFEIKESDVIIEGEEQEVATFTGIANVMEHEDLGGDVIHKGAFKKTLEDKDGSVPFVTDHTYSIKNAIGVAYLEEQGELLKAKVTVLLSNNSEGKEFISKAKFFQARGKPLGLSIGYDIPKGKFEMKDGTRHIYEIKLYEVSGVLFPMNTLSRAVGFKSYKYEDLEHQKKLIDDILEVKGQHLSEFLNNAVNEMAQSQEDIQRIIGELAERTGMSRDRVAEVINGDMIRPSDQILGVFSEVLDVPFEQLLTLADNDIGKGAHEDEDDMKQQKQVEAVSPSDAGGQDEFMTSCISVLNHMNIEDSDEERSQLCLTAWQEAQESDDEAKTLEELSNTFKKSLLNDEPSDDTHSAEADLLELKHELEQLNKSQDNE